LRVLDGAVAIFDSVGGVEPQSETVWHQADKYSVPRIAFVNKMDRAGADFDRVMGMLQKKLTMTPVAIQYPVGKEECYAGVVDLVRMKVCSFDDETHGSSINETEIPESLLEEASYHREEMLEKICDFDDELMQLVIEGREAKAEIIRRAIRKGVLSGKIYPVLCGTALKNKGVQQVLDAVVEFLPSPIDRGVIIGKHPQTGETVTRNPDSSDPFSGLIFKVASDGHAGKLAYFRVYSGKAGFKDSLINPRTGSKERLARIYRMHSNRRKQIDTAEAGEIVGIVGLKDAVTGDTLCDARNPVYFERMVFPEPVVSRTIEPRSAAEEEKLSAALLRLTEEDPTCSVTVDNDTGQRLISGMGELHLEILTDRLTREFNVDVHVGKQQVAYRETISIEAVQLTEFLQPVGGKNQYASVKLTVLPVRASNGIEFVSQLSPGEVPEPFVNAVRQGVLESCSGGELAGYPVIGILVKLENLGIREDDTTEMACKIAGAMAFRQACLKASPALLEPVMKLEVVVPEEYVGSVMNDLSARRGRVTGMNLRGGLQIIDAESPLSEMFGYATALRSLTQGRAVYTMQFDKYEMTEKTIQNEVLKRIGRV
jgi:elongation factor G